MLAQKLLIVVRAILATEVRVVNAAPGRTAQGDGHIQSPDGQIAFHPVADSPTYDTSGMQVEDNGQVEPPSQVHT
ncbi:hypothetical protein GCM10009077_10950 [Roseibium denhamense]